MKKNKWSIQEVWNKQLVIKRKDSKLEPRSHIWASEIGKSYWDRWAKMKGIKPDFDYDEITLRKFATGDFFERIIGYVLVVSGLLKYDNKWHQIPESKDMLKVSVKPDFIAGGKPDWRKVEEDLSSNPIFSLIPAIERISKSLVKYLAKKYPNGMDDIVYEIKSVNSMLFWAKKKYLADAYPHHKMQLFTGMKATGLPEGRMLYISKDDLTVAEFPIFLEDEGLNELWNTDVKTMTSFIREGKEPPKPDWIVFDETKHVRFQKNKVKHKTAGAWVPNWEIEWSLYLPTITGCKTKEEWLLKAEMLAKPKNDELKNEYISKL
jgi:hypothetical protein